MTQHPQGTAPQHPQGTIRLTIQGSEMTAGLIAPTVAVSGHRLNSGYGTTDVPVWAGPNRVDVHANWMREYGQASLDLVVRPGEVVPVYYAVPWHQFTRGAIGHQKQTRPGAAAMVWVFTAIALGSVALVFGIIAAG